MTEPTVGTTPDIGPFLVNIRQAAKALGVSERTLWAMVKAGEIPSVRCGRRRLFDPRDLVAWVDANKERGNL